MNGMYGYSPQSQDNEFLKRLLQMLMGQAQPVADFSTRPQHPFKNPSWQEALGNSIVMQSLYNGPKLGYSVKVPGADMIHIDDRFLDAAGDVQQFKRQAPRELPTVPTYNRQLGV